MKDDNAGPSPEDFVRRDQPGKKKNGKNEFDVEVDIINPVVGHFVFDHPNGSNFRQKCIKKKYAEYLPPAGAGA